MVAIVEGLDEHASGPLGGRGHRLRLVDARRERLLAENVLARLEGTDRPLGVERVRQRIVDGVDLRVGEQCRIRFVDAGNLMPRREAPRALRVAGGDREDARFGHPSRRPHERHGRDPRRAEDAEAKGTGHIYASPRRRAGFCRAIRSMAGAGTPARSISSMKSRIPSAGWGLLSCPKSVDMRARSGPTAIIARAKVAGSSVAAKPPGMQVR